MKINLAFDFGSLCFVWMYSKSRVLSLANLDPKCSLNALADAGKDGFSLALQDDDY